MHRDLFTLFPDLPWPRIGHPVARRWEGLPPPPRTRGRHRPGSTGDQRLASQSVEQHAALQRILSIALSERRRLKPNSPARRSFDRIAELAHGALS